MLTTMRNLLLWMKTALWELVLFFFLAFALVVALLSALGQS